MAEKEGHGGLGAIGAAGGGLLLLLARFGDDCARTGAHLAPLADDAARVTVEAGAATKVVGELGDDAARAGRLGALGEGATQAIGEEVRLGAGEIANAGEIGAMVVDDAGRVRFVEDLGHVVKDHGLDIADLASNLPDEPGSESPASDTPPHPRLVVAHAANPPDPGPIDPLVLLVDPLSPDDRATLTQGCATSEHRCVVLECADAACVDGWQGVWKDLGKEDSLVGHPEAIANALLLAATRQKALTGSHLTAATLGPTGIGLVERTIGPRGAERIR